MKRIIIMLVLLALAIVTLAWCLPPPPPPVGSPTPTDVPPTDTSVPPTATNAPTVTIQPSATQPVQDTPTAAPVPTPTSPAVPTEPFVPLEPTLTLTPMTIPPTETATSTRQPTMTITLPPREPHDTPTPVKYYYTPEAKLGNPTCPVGGCDLVIDTDTLVEGNTLRVRFWNTSGTTATMKVRVSVDGDHNQSLSDVVEANSTGETVFTIPCVENAQMLEVEITFPGYIANQYISYPDCICAE